VAGGRVRPPTHGDRTGRGSGGLLEPRYQLLEDALEALPLLWGKGAPAFTGRQMVIPEAIGYPRPVQECIPVLVGGGGERRTLRLAARYADAINVMGDADTLARKVEVLLGHCRDLDRDPAEITVTALAPTLMGGDRSEVRAFVDRLRPPRLAADRFAASVHAGTPADQLDRFRAFAANGADEVIVSLPRSERARWMRTPRSWTRSHR